MCRSLQPTTSRTHRSGVFTRAPNKLAEVCDEETNGMFTAIDQSRTDDQSTAWEQYRPQVL
jgi:hypothetical protein